MTLKVTDNHVRSALLATAELLVSICGAFVGQ